MKYEPLSARTVTLFCVAVILVVNTVNARAEEVTVVSPDKRWEYQGGDGIVKVDTKEGVLDIINDQEENGIPLKPGSASGAKVIWAPDSNRLAFNYRELSPEAYYIVTTAFYQLRGDKWVRSRVPLDTESDRGQLAQLVKQHFPKGDVAIDILRVRNWADANTAILYCHCEWKGDQEGSFLFTLRFDREGNAKIIKSHLTSKKEAAAEEAKEAEGG